MYRPAVEFPLFCSDDREDVREFLGNYKRAGSLNGWEKLALGLPLFLKTQQHSTQHSSLWFKTLSGSENLAFEVLSQKRISYFDSRAIEWQMRQKLEVRRLLLRETVADYTFDIP